MAGLTEREWAAREARVLAARAAIEGIGKHPSWAAIAFTLGWNKRKVERVVVRLAARGAWPASPVPPTRANRLVTRPALPEIEVPKGKPPVISRQMIAEESGRIRAKWSAAVELARRVTAPVPARIPRWSGTVGRVEI